MALKIRGFFEKEEDARGKLDQIMNIDDTFQSYVVGAYHWLPAEPDVDSIEDQVYQNEELDQAQ